MRTKKDEGWGKLKRGTAKALARVPMGCNESRVVNAIIYKTICFNKISDIIPLSQLEDLTGLDRRNMKRSINSLLKKGVIWREHSACGLCRRFLDFEGVSVETQKDKGVSVAAKRGVTSPYNSGTSDTLIRSSHKNIQKKRLSPKEEEEKNRGNIEGIGSILKALRKQGIKTKKNQ